MTTRHRSWIRGAAGCALLAAAVIALGAIGLYSWINSSMVPQSLKATVLPPEKQLTLVCEDAQGRSLEIREVVADLELHGEGGRSIPLASPRVSADGRRLVYGLPDGIDPSSRLTISAPNGWAVAASGPLPAFQGVPVETQPRKTQEPVASTRGPRTKSAPAPHEEIENRTDFTFHSARVVTSGRAVEVVFSANEPPADVAAFVDRQLSRADELTISGSKPRASLKFAGVSTARGENDVYLFTLPLGSDNRPLNDSTQGESLLIYLGDQLVHTIPPISGEPVLERVRSELGNVLNAIPEDDALVSHWRLRSPAASDNETPAETQNQTYSLEISDGQTTIEVESIAYRKPSQRNNAGFLVEALRTALGTENVTTYSESDGNREFDIVFEREGCPIWPIRSITVKNPSVAGLLEPEARRQSPARTQIISGSLAINLKGSLGCRDLGLSIRSSVEGGFFDDCWQRWVQGDDRHRWNATWYIEDPAEVIPFGESLTISGPEDLLVGAAVNFSAGEAEPSGDRTLAFTDEPVQNLSWAGPDGDLSGDLCWVTDQSEGVDNGWERWRREAPPAAWIRTRNQARSLDQANQVPIRIAYVDPDYDGSNGEPQINDPTRPYTSLRQFARTGSGRYDLMGVSNFWTYNPLVMRSPMLILVKRGTLDPWSDNALEGFMMGWGLSREAPTIVSTYWMEADGPEPGPEVETVASGMFIFNQDSPGGAANIVFHGLTVHGHFHFNVLHRDFALWDCVFPPHRNSHKDPNTVVSQASNLRLSIIRTTIMDHWGRTAHTNGIYFTQAHQALLDQTAWIRNGFRAFSGGYDGELRDPGNPNEAVPGHKNFKPTYMEVMGGDPTAMPPEPHDNVFSHNVYGQNGFGGPTLVLNSFGFQTAGNSFMLRSGARIYGCAHYREGDVAESTIGDSCTARLAGAHLRRNLFLNKNSHWAVQCSMFGYSGISGSLALLIEDCLILDPEPGKLGTPGIMVGSIASIVNNRATVVRHNTLLDQYLDVSRQTAALSAQPPASFRAAVLRNLVSRSDAPGGEAYLVSMAHLGATPPWPWLRVDHNLYLAADPLRASFAHPGQHSILDLETWQAVAGQDAHSHFRGPFTPEFAGGPTSAGRDLLVEYLGSKVPGVSDQADALNVLRDRRPGQWNDAIHAPLGAGDGGLIGYAESVYRPVGIEDIGDGYYGAVDYREAGVEDPPPAQGISQRARKFVSRRKR